MLKIGAYKNTLGGKSIGIKSIRLISTVFHFTCQLVQNTERGHSVAHTLLQETSVWSPPNLCLQSPFENW